VGWGFRRNDERHVQTRFLRPFIGPHDEKRRLMGRRFSSQH
jgi:hypothetical protein